MLDASAFAKQLTQKWLAITKIENRPEPRSFAQDTLRRTVICLQHMAAQSQRNEMIVFDILSAASKSD
ncbi:hypothetical protein AD943_08665 [Gluconobacter roseus]|nr:hypothetical protein AD943_08665 [Gluconobacter roseus]